MTNNRIRKKNQIEKPREQWLNGVRRNKAKKDVTEEDA